LHGRLRRGEEDPAKYGLEKAPENDELIVLYEPKISHSTKIETFDRYQTEVDVPIPVLAGLVGSEPQEVDDLALAVYDVMIKDAEKAGLFIVADGKVEMIMGPDRKIYVGDTGYSWDENRLLWEFPDGSFVDISKQFPRNIYAIRGYKGEITKAKKEFPKDKSRWPDPPLLDDNQIGIMTDANEAVRMAILGEKGAERAVKDVAYRAKDELERLKELYKRDETGAEI
ncbi:MAG: hypothetical protein KAT35_03930, partial [Candidatus Aenigmarchaeota archaeon]|nr:hypothetical protein [Candidatus Aenigmarchaeota archaeon]